MSALIQYVSSMSANIDQTYAGITEQCIAVTNCLNFLDSHHEMTVLPFSVNLLFLKCLIMHIALVMYAMPFSSLW